MKFSNQFYERAGILSMSILFAIFHISQYVVPQAHISLQTALYSPLVIFNLSCFCIYLWLCYKILRLTGSTFCTLAGFFIININPFIHNLFLNNYTLSISVALMFTAIYFLAIFLKSGEGMLIILSTVATAFAALLNENFIYFSASFSLSFAAYLAVPKNASITNKKIFYAAAVTFINAVVIIFYILYPEKFTTSYLLFSFQYIEVFVAAILFLQIASLAIFIRAIYKYPEKWLSYFQLIISFATILSILLAAVFEFFFVAYILKLLPVLLLIFILALRQLLLWHKYVHFYLAAAGIFSVLLFLHFYFFQY